MSELRPPSGDQVRGDVERALAEDVGDGDLTASLVPADSRLVTQVVCREPAVLAGRPWFDAVFQALDPGIEIRWFFEDGDHLDGDDVVLHLEGQARPILTGERAALNFLQTLSATATRARAYVDRVAGSGVVMLDTRKTLPGLRLAQKYAVRCGGAQNHRVGLYDAILVKENHIAAAGSISNAVQQARSEHPDVFLQVEVENLRQLEEALGLGVSRVLLDNFSLEEMRVASQTYGQELELEASGNVSLDTVADIARTGVHFISCGDLTKSLQAIDFSMRYL